MNRVATTFAAVALALLESGAIKEALAEAGCTTGQTAQTVGVQTGYADVNGLHMYYEIHGTGRPVVALHGAYMSTQSMKDFVGDLAKTRQVIVMDLQGHGRTADIERPVTYEAMADDVSALMDKIGVPKADAFGYSMGAGVAYQLAIRHPEHVSRLAAASGTFDSQGIYPELVAMFGQITPEAFAGSPYEAEYKTHAPKPQDFPKLVEKLKALDMAPQAWSPDDIKKIKSPTLVISADADIIRPEHSLQIFRLRGGGHSPDFMAPVETELAILPGTSHIGILTERTHLVSTFVAEFFDRQCK